MQTKETIENEIHNFDYSVFKKFESKFKPEIDEFISNMQNAHKEFVFLDKNTNGNEDKAYFSSLIFWSFSALLHSLKILCHGYQIPSGNLMRQCIEAIAFCIYATDKSNKSIEKFKNGKISTNKSVEKLNNRKIQSKLGINKEAVSTMINAKKFYDNFSHPSKMTIASTISFETQDVYVGASYDVQKEYLYEKEFNFRVSLSRDLPEIIKHINEKISAWQS